MGYAVVIAAVVAAAGTVTNTVLTIFLRRFVSPPSGGTLGEIAERAHHNSVVGVAGVKYMARQVNHGELPAEIEEADAVKPPDGAVEF